MSDTWKVNRSNSATHFAIALDPSYEVFGNNVLFDPSSKWNRDGHLTPFHRLYSELNESELVVNTADLLIKGKFVADINYYYSFGILDNYEKLKLREDVVLKDFVLWEPPIVAPDMYQALPAISACFERVLVHNTVGDGYSLKDVDQSKLVKLFFPQPYKGVLQQFWEKNDRLNRVVVINGNHKPKSRMGELYSKRIEAMSELAKFNVIDLYGAGWNQWCSRRSLWMPYWRNRKVLTSIYRGACESKYEMLSRYRFCLCFENMKMTGLVTEKIFDCLYAGTIPLYLGAPDIESLIPSDAYIDCRSYESWADMWKQLSRMSAGKADEIRQAGRDFLNSDEFLKYYNTLPNQIMSSFDHPNEE